MSQPIVVRKYENRRLYDTSSSRYVNLPEIAQMVREGAEVQVVDAKSGEDITRVILTQIIHEVARQKKGDMDGMFIQGWCADFPHQTNWLPTYFNSASFASNSRCSSSWCAIDSRASSWR